VTGMQLRKNWKRAQSSPAGDENRRGCNLERIESAAAQPLTVELKGKDAT